MSAAALAVAVISLVGAPASADEPRAAGGSATAVRTAWMAAEPSETSSQGQPR
jgi:hypothetical protein